MGGKSGSRKARSPLRSRLSYANATATIALFVALGGGAYAMGLGPDSVRGWHIREDSIKSKHVKGDSLRGNDILESSLDLPAATNGAPNISVYHAEVLTEEATTEPYNPDGKDLPTPGPSVTVDVPEDSYVTVALAADGKSSASGTSCQLGVDPVQAGHGGVNGTTFSSQIIPALASVPAGSVTLTAKYGYDDDPHWDPGTCTYKNRKLWVTVIGPAAG